MFDVIFNISDRYHQTGLPPFYPISASSVVLKLWSSLAPSITFLSSGVSLYAKPMLLHPNKKTNKKTNKKKPLSFELANATNTVFKTHFLVCVKSITFSNYSNYKPDEKSTVCMRGLFKQTRFIQMKTDVSHRFAFQLVGMSRMTITQNFRNEAVNFNKWIQHIKDTLQYIQPPNIHSNKVHY